MLVINREVGQTLIISEDIKVTVLDINKPQVKIGIDAPKQYVISRDEKQKNNNKRKTKSKPKRKFTR